MYTFCLPNLSTYSIAAVVVVVPKSVSVYHVYVPKAHRVLLLT